MGFKNTEGDGKELHPELVKVMKQLIKMGFPNDFEGGGEHLRLNKVYGTKDINDNDTAKFKSVADKRKKVFFLGYDEEGCPDWEIRTYLNNSKNNENLLTERIERKLKR